ncbi:hypothetical protein LPJ54_005292 [Coemansia sp. RSA 1824]|nr:hypothetical protein LPJ54_005292 [Coemansia sp. RSA 1824]
MTPTSQRQTVLASGLTPENRLLVVRQRDPISVEHAQILDRNSEEAGEQILPAEWRRHLGCTPEWQERAQESSLVMASVNVNGLPREGEVAVEELANIMVGFSTDILAM